MNSVIELNESLADRLRQSHVRIETTDRDTLFLRNVPPNPAFFNKRHTNLLIKRARAGLPFVVCVDEDLEYTGDDAALRRAFEGAHRQQGWRVLSFTEGAGSDAGKVAERALAALGFDGTEPLLKTLPTGAQEEEQRGLLRTFGTSLTELIRSGRGEPTIGRDETIAAVISCLLRRDPAMPLIAGRAGTGKSNLLLGVARNLIHVRPALAVVSVDLGVLMAGTLFDSERDSLLSSLLAEVAQSEETVLAIEHAELALVGVPRGQWLLSQALDRGASIIGTSLADTWFAVAPLLRRISVFEVSEPWPDELFEIVKAHADLIAAHHCLAVDDVAVRSAIRASADRDSRYPAKAIALLDAAAARASLESAAAVAPVHIESALGQFKPDNSRDD